MNLADVNAQVDNVARTGQATAKRPSASKGIGFFVVGDKLYDANGNEFRMRGTNKTHQDASARGLGKTNSNATRWIIYFSDEPDRTIKDFQSPDIGGTTVNGHDVIVGGYWDGTCKNDKQIFDKMVDRWTRDAAKYQTIEKYMILNIANEWGGDGPAWRDAYQAAIPKIRKAGWHGAIMVDAPGCGQNPKPIIQFGREVFDADPEKNVLFGVHIYGGWYDQVGGVPSKWNDQHDLHTTLDALKETGLTIVIGEFGPGRDIGPSPTMITPERVVAEAEAHGFGWLSWSWDDNDKEGGKCSNGCFCHAYDPDADPTQENLTDFGKAVVPLWDAHATTCSIFD
jgi:mannan endo-1,4-beta-mannosidase